MQHIRSLLAAAACLLLAAPAFALEPRAGVTLRALDKITGNSTDIDARVGKTVSFGRLEITPRACWQSPPEDTPESVAFLEISAKPTSRRGLAAIVEEPQPRQSRDKTPLEPTRLFSGWMYASSPGLNALEHPTYDVWVISCSAS